MGLQDDAQNTWDKVKDGFNERLGNDTSSEDNLSPEDEAILGEDMSSVEGASSYDDEMIADPIEDAGAARDYTDEDRA